MSNKLIHEKSPYLLQHANNPVDWYPWGDEALALAKKLNRPIFLSIGYSTCHWCHVMEHESFENPDIAALMNKTFINIKVDREERPDLDALYMNAVQALSGSGGWPMSVWLTPELKPFYGGTYFPPENRYGRPGFPNVVTQLAEVWEKERERVVEASQQITSLLENSLAASAGAADAPPTSEVVAKAVYESLRASFDAVNGGFGPAPKFPMPVYLEFLLSYHVRTGEPLALEMAKLTMQKIGRGGITDQLGGGFARYSTDDTWTVPHFEKMLYDNAQLLSVTATLFQITRDPFFCRLARAAITYVLRDLRHPEGGFFSAEDADSEGKEGTFYLWTLHQIKSLLGTALTEEAVPYFGVTSHGNFHDPHTREAGKNVLIRAGETAPARLNEIEEKLLAERNKRPRPHRDDKVLTEWNGLMISALARAGAIFEEPSYLEAAQKAAAFIEERLYDRPGRQLYRRWRDGDRKIEAQQADYAFFVQGLLDLFETTGELHWLDLAAELEDIQDQRFYDPAGGGYFMNAVRSDLLFQMKDDGDNVIPSGNSAAAINGFRLAHLTGNDGYAAKARGTLNAFARRLNERAMTLAKMAMALDFEARGPAHVVIIGRTGSPDTAELRRIVFKEPRPGLVIIPVDPQGTQKEIGRRLPFVASLTMKDGRATAYVCQNYACQQPTTDAKELDAQLHLFVRRT